MIGHSKKSIFQRLKERLNIIPLGMCGNIAAGGRNKVLICTALLKKFELEGDYTSRLAYLEELKTLPFAAVWDKYCEIQNVPQREAWVAEVKKYEADVLSKR